ncbi:hypothetical protein K523DRAFT_228684, partial [Schizophyllum commune Tattone D]
LSKTGFPAMLGDNATPQVRSLHRPRYPRYAFGWLVALAELADRAVKETGVGRDPIDYGLQLFRDAGFERSQYHWQFVFPDGKPRFLLYVATNDSAERLDMAKNEEYIARAKAVLRRTEDGRWFHIDSF